MKHNNCKTCLSPYHTAFVCPSKPRKPLKITKPMKKRGKRSRAYEEWRDNIAKPYLDKKYGRVCAACKGARCGNLQLDIDHILKRGSHPELVMTLSNLQYLGRYPCHWEKDNT